MKTSKAILLVAAALALPLAASAAPTIKIISPTKNPVLSENSNVEIFKQPRGNNS
jgi:hypothetical protein